MYEGMNQRPDVSIHLHLVDKHMYATTIPYNTHGHTALINQGNPFC